MITGPVRERELSGKPAYRPKFEPPISSELLCPSSGILKKHTKECNISETEPVPVLRLRVGDIYSIGSLRKTV
jgi:hypothetical protein